MSACINLSNARIYANGSKSKGCGFGGVFEGETTVEVTLDGRRGVVGWSKNGRPLCEMELSAKMRSRQLFMIVAMQDQGDMVQFLGP